MRRLRRAKIVATLGPASSNADMIAQLFKAGADVFRINMSHTTQDRMRELVGMIRAVERDTGRPIGVLIDLQGPKLRLGTFTGGSAIVKAGDTFVLDADTAAGDAKRAVGMIRAVERDTGRPIGVLIDLQGPKLRLGTFTGGSATVKTGDTFVLDADTAAGDARRAHLPHPEIFATIKPGHTLLIDDGKVRLTVTEADSKAHHDPRRSRRKAVRPQGREPAGHDDPVFGSDR